MSSTKRGNEFEDRGEPSKQVKVEEGGESQPEVKSNQSEAEKAAEAAGQSSSAPLIAPLCLPVPPSSIRTSGERPRRGGHARHVDRSIYGPGAVRTGTSSHKQLQSPAISGVRAGRATRQRNDTGPAWSQLGD